MENIIAWSQQYHDYVPIFKSSSTSEWMLIEDSDSRTYWSGIML